MWSLFLRKASNSPNWNSKGSIQWWFSRALTQCVFSSLYSCLCSPAFQRSEHTYLLSLLFLSCNLDHKHLKAKVLVLSAKSHVSRIFYKGVLIVTMTRGSAVVKLSNFQASLYLNSSDCEVILLSSQEEILWRFLQVWSFQPNTLLWICCLCIRLLKSEIQGKLKIT